MSSFLFVTETSNDDRVIEGIASRENEINDYEMSAANFRAILAGYSDLGAWPAHLEQYRDLSRDAIAKKLDGADLDLASQLTHRDQVTHLLKTTEIECAKSRKILEVLMTTLPQERLDAAVQRYRDKLAAAGGATA